jgi:hypothetical protein
MMENSMVAKNEVASRVLHEESGHVPCEASEANELKGLHADIGVESLVKTNIIIFRKS